MSDASVNIVIKSQADTSGVGAAKQALNELGNTARGVETQWDKLSTTVSKKLTIQDAAKSILGGIGFGSVFAAAQTSAQLLIEYWKKAAEQAKVIADEAERHLAAEKEIKALGQTDAQNIVALRKDQADAQKKLADINALGASKVAYKTPVDETGMSTSIQTGVTRGLTDKEQADQLKLAKQIDEREAQITSLSLKLQSTADAERALLSEDAKFAQEKKRINDLVGANGLTQAEADARIAQLSHDRTEKLSQDAAARSKGQIDEETAISAAQKKIQDAYTQSANAYKELADPQQKYHQQLAEIDALTKTYTADGKPFLTQQQAAAATARLLAEQNDTAGKAIRSAREEVESYDIALAILDKNPALSDSEKQRQRVVLIDEQTAAIGRAKKALQDFMATNPGVDVGGITSALDAFGDKGARNAGLTQPAQTLQQRDAIGVRDLDDPAKHYQSAGEGVAGGVMQYFAQVGTMADQLANGIKNTLGNAVESITGEIMKWDGTGRGALQAIGNIGRSIFQGMIQQLVQMGVQWLLNQALVKTGLITTEAIGDTLRAGRVVKENAAEAATLPLKTAGAAATGVSSFGAAIVFGLLAVALIASLAGGFAEGGYTAPGAVDKPAGVVHAGEWVAPQWMVDDDRYAPMIGALEAARSGQSGYSMGGFVKLLGRGLPRWAQDPISKWVADRYNPADGTELYGEKVDAWDASGAASGLADVSSQVGSTLPAAADSTSSSSSSTDTSSFSTGDTSSGAAPRVYVMFDRQQFVQAMQEDSEGWFQDMSQRFKRKNG